MLVLGINKILNWCHITSGGRNYTCPTKLIDGKFFFTSRKNGIVWLNLFPTTQRSLFQKVARFSLAFSKSKRR